MRSILKKELQEWFSGGFSGRYGRYEFAVYAALIGVAVPIIASFSSHKHGSTGSFEIGYASVIPIVVMLYSIADATAGERERGTIEYLCSLPLSSREIVLGKWLAAVVYVGCLYVAVTVLTSLTTYILRQPLPPFRIIVSLQLGGYAASIVLGAVQSVFAMRFTSVKNAVIAGNVVFAAGIFSVTQFGDFTNSVLRKFEATSPQLMHLLGSWVALQGLLLFGVLVGSIALLFSIRYLDRIRLQSSLLG